MMGQKRISLMIGLLVVFAGLTSILSQSGRSYAHFFGGQTKEVNGYSIVFVPSPDPPFSTDNKTTLNFSVLLSGDNIYNIQAAIIVKEKGTNKTVGQTDYLTKEYSDVSFHFTFPHPGDYIVTLLVKVAGDRSYSDNPLSAEFNISAYDPKFPVPFDELMLLYVTPASIAIAGIVVYLHSKNKI